MFLGGLCLGWKKPFPILSSGHILISYYGQSSVYRQLGRVRIRSVNLI